MKWRKIVKIAKIVAICVVFMMLMDCAQTEQQDINNEEVKTEGNNPETTTIEDSNQMQAVNGAGSGIEKPVQFVVATDIHYFSKDLTDNGALFQRMLVSSDGKQVNYITEITDAFLEEVIKMQPTGLILSGDLTFNGEKKSHEELGEKLKAVTEAGIPVYVIPGNHDLNNYYASRYQKDGLVEVRNTSPEEFKKIYGSLDWTKQFIRMRKP